MRIADQPSPTEPLRGYSGKYRELYDHLRGLTSREWRASFAEIESIVGFRLPDSARKYPAWWANETSGSHVHAQSWQSAGWRTYQVDIGGERVVFVRR